MWTSGKHAAPIENSYSSRISSISSREYSSPPVGRGPLRLAGRRVAAQGEDVLDAAVAHRVEHLAQLVRRGADAGEVRHRLHAVVALEVADDVDRLAPLGLAPARAVGDRHERRVEARELGQRAAQVALPLVGLRREELERERGLGAGRDPLVDPHAPSLGGGPALGLARTAHGLARELEVVEVGEQLDEQALRAGRVVLGREDVRQQLERGRLAAGERGAERLQPLARRARGCPRRGRAGR